MNYYIGKLVSWKSVFQKKKKLPVSSKNVSVCVVFKKYVYVYYTYLGFI